MCTVTAKKIFFIMLIIIFSVILFYYSTQKTNIKINPRGCDEESSRACWWEKKQQLNKNIANVCNKYADYIDEISGRLLQERKDVPPI